MQSRQANGAPLPSAGPRRQIVCCGSALLVIDALLPDRRHRPVPADEEVLIRFSALMADEGWSAHVSRLAFDRAYARERFRLALGGRGRALRTLGASLLHRLGDSPR